jgi:GNAT superfamily N-acetyltransferase
VKSRVYFGIETKRVRETSPLERLDAILKSAKKDLVRKNEELESMLDRFQDAEEDSTRLLVYARNEGRTVGIADALVNTPEPTDVTVQQIAVHPRARNQNVGRAMVLEVLMRARKEVGELGNIVAAVHPENHGAAAFWEAMGLRADEHEVQAKESTLIFIGPASELLEALRESAGDDA